MKEQYTNSKDRDFKGVWIEKDIWLSTTLSAIEKILLSEIASLDNENHCWASNEYLSEFCNCSIPTITRAIKHLKDLKLIEISNFDGRSRVIKMIRQPNQNDEADSSKRLTSNIDNNIDNKVDNKLSTKPGNKLNRYEKGIQEIKDRGYSKEVTDALIEYYKVLLNINPSLYANVWKSKLNNFDKYFSSKSETAKLQRIEICTSGPYQSLVFDKDREKEKFDGKAGVTVGKLSGEKF